MSAPVSNLQSALWQITETMAADPSGSGGYTRVYPPCETSAIGLKGLESIVRQHGFTFEEIPWDGTAAVPTYSAARWTSRDGRHVYEIRPVFVEGNPS